MVDPTTDATTETTSAATEVTVARGVRDVVRVSGPDAVGYVHSQVSQDVQRLAVGDSAWTFVLEPAGKVVALARVTREADDVLSLDTDPGFGDQLSTRLARFKIRVRAELSTSTEPITMVRGFAGQRPAGAIVGWGDGYDALGDDGALLVPAGARPIDEAEVLAQRIEAAWPAMGAEIVPGETIPAETGISSVAVSFTKGCYPGQELVERMDSRGASAPRSLRVVDVAAGTQPGDALHDGDDLAGPVIGRVTSVAGTRALATVKRSAPASA